MGKASSFKTGDGFCPTRHQKDRNQYGYPGEIVGQIEGVLGGEEKIRQEVILFRISASSLIVTDGHPTAINVEISLGRFLRRSIMICITKTLGKSNDHRATAPATRSLLRRRNRYPADNGYNKRFSV